MFFTLGVLIGLIGDYVKGIRTSILTMFAVELPADGQRPPTEGTGDKRPSLTTVSIVVLQQGIQLMLRQKDAAIQLVVGRHRAILFHILQK